MREMLFLLGALCVFRGVAEEGKMELPPVKVRYTVEGTYEVRRSGDRIGREDFVRTLLSNNTVIYESVFEVLEDEETVVTGNNRLEVEEDSGFPRSYSTRRRTGGPDGESVREVTVEMYSNVAVVSERHDERERRHVLTLPTGCLFVEGNTAGHLVVVLDRFDRELGGAQSFRAFDPLGVATTDVMLESVGDSTLAGVEGTATGRFSSGVVEHFRYRAGRSPSIDFFADGEGRVVRVDVPSSELEYDLVALEQRPGDAEPAEGKRPR